MKYFLLFTSIGCFMIAIACGSLYQATSPSDPATSHEPRSMSSEKEPGFVHR